MVKNVTRTFAIFLAERFLIGIASGNLVELHIIVIKYWFPKCFWGNVPTLSTKYVKRVSWKQGWDVWGTMRISDSSSNTQTHSSGSLANKKCFVIVCLVNAKVPLQRDLKYRSHYVRSLAFRENYLVDSRPVFRIRGISGSPLPHLYLIFDKIPNWNFLQLIFGQHITEDWVEFRISPLFCYK